MLDWLLGRRIDPSRHRVVKFLPMNPPHRREHVLVDGERCRVTYCRTKWQRQVGQARRWTILSLRVKADP